MILDMNINLDGIDEEFLDELEELIEETRVEYFMINPLTKTELEKTQNICKEFERFKYTLPVEFFDLQDENCMAFHIKKPDDLEKLNDEPVVVESKALDEQFIKLMNEKQLKGVVLNAKQRDITLQNFAFSISHNSLKEWSKEAITDLDYNLLALQSDYPEQSYEDFLDVMLKEISDMTFRAEQTIAAGGTRTVLKTFSLL